MNRIKRITAAVLSACMILLAAGCAALDTIKEKIVEETGGVTVDNTNTTEVSNSISVGIIDFDTFNPLVTKSQTVKECMEFVYEPLFDVNEKLQPVPVLADSYTVSPDGRTIDILLKNNVVWQDGSNFTAYDAAYTIKQIRSGITEYTENIAGMADYLATGDYSLRIVLNYAVPDFVSLLTFPIVQYKTDMSVNPHYIPMGTGAFRYNAQVSAGKLSFTAFENCHNGRAKIDTLYVHTVPDLQKYESMFEANEIDLMTGETVDLSEYTPRGSAVKNEYITNKMTYVGYNFQNKLLSGADTRKGLSLLIDKESIVNSTIYSRGIACNVPINPSSVYYYDTNTKFKSDELLALQHLGDDGWGINSEGKYERKINGERQVLGFEILTNADSAEKVNIANKISDTLNEFGIPAVVLSLPYEQYVSRINAKNFDIMIGETELSANLDLTPLVSSSDNYFSYQNNAVDMLIGQMGMTRDEEQLKTLYRQYGDTIINDMPFSVLFFRKGDVMSGSKIKSGVVPSVSRLYRNVETWSVK